MLAIENEYTKNITDRLSTSDQLYKELSAITKPDCVPIDLTQKSGSPRENGNNFIIFDNRKYYDRAVNYEKVLVLAAEGKDYPSFKVDLADISISLKRELVTKSRFQLQNVLRQAILRIYKDFDEEHNKFLPKPPKSSNLRSNMARDVANILRVDLV